MEWQQIAPHFEWDGSWRDIYVLDATESNWQSVREVLQEWVPTPVYSIDGVKRPMPESVAEAFSVRGTASPLLTVVVDVAHLHGHFFSPDEIEFDLDPREVTGLGQAKALADFMRLLGEITAKTVILTAENSQEHVLARYSPGDGEVAWNTPPSNER